MKTTFNKIYWTEKNKTFEVVADFNINLMLNLQEFETMIKDKLNVKEVLNLQEIKDKLLD